MVGDTSGAAAGRPSAVLGEGNWHGAHATMGSLNLTGPSLHRRYTCNVTEVARHASIIHHPPWMLDDDGGLDGDDGG